MQSINNIQICCQMRQFLVTELPSDSIAILVRIKSIYDVYLSSLAQVSGHTSQEALSNELTGKYFSLPLEL